MIIDNIANIFVWSGCIFIFEDNNVQPKIGLRCAKVCTHTNKKHNKFVRLVCFIQSNSFHSRHLLAPKISAYLSSKHHGLLVVELSGDIRRLQIEITIYPESAVRLGVCFCLGSVRITTTKPLRRRPDRTRPYTCSSRCRATSIRIQAMLHSTPVPFVLATSLVEEN